MFTIAVVAKKGNAGKTPLVMNVAASLEDAGGSAALVDIVP